MQTTLTKPSYKQPLIIFVLAATAVVLFLFFTDEGNYSLKGFTNPVHWLVFLIYLMPTVLAQFLTYLFLTKLNMQHGKLTFSVVIGLFFGIASVISLFYLMK